MYRPLPAYMILQESLNGAKKPEANCFRLRKDLACAKSLRTSAEALVVLMSTEFSYKFW